MSDTIQSADAFGSQVVKLAGIGILGDKEKAIESSNAIGALIRSRDADIRADEARKQAERYAAVIKELKTCLAICDPVSGKSLSDIYKPDSNGCIFCSNNKVCGYLTDNDALADLEAPK
jgi:hypothetical protein